MTPAGSQPATFRLVAQHLNRCVTAVPITVYYFVKLTVHVIINNHVLFCDPNATCFGPYRPSSDMSFTKEYMSYVPLHSSVMTSLKMAHRGRNM